MKAHVPCNSLLAQSRKGLVAALTLHRSVSRIVDKQKERVESRGNKVDSTSVNSAINAHSYMSRHGQSSKRQ